MDRNWEIAGTVAAGVALALFLAYHKGKGTPDVSMAQRQQLPPPPKFPTLGDIVGQDAADAADYNSARDFGGNAFDIDYTGPVYNIVQNVNNVSYNIPAGTLIPLNVLDITNTTNVTQLGDVIQRPTYNVTSGTPQCGCSAPDVTDLNGILQAEHDKFNAILAALQAIKPVEPASNIYVTLVSLPGQNAPGSGFNAVAQGRYTTTDAGGYQADHFTGGYP